jgi:5-methyltetrahydropteroyltriglutamate--homocysteine methyltransferase
MIPTEPIGSIPRPPGPVAAIRGGAVPGALALVREAA